MEAFITLSKFSIYVFLYNLKWSASNLLFFIEYSNYFLWVTADREHLRGASGRSPNLPSFLTLICIILLFCSSRVALKRGMTTRDQTIQWTNWNSLSHRGDEWPLKFFTARKILPLLDLFAKFTRVLACSCSPNFCSCSHVRFLVSIARNFFGLKQEKK